MSDDKDFIDDAYDAFERVESLESEITRLRRVNAALVEAMGVALESLGDHALRDAERILDNAIRSSTETKDEPSGAGCGKDVIEPWACDEKGEPT